MKAKCLKNHKRSVTSEAKTPRSRIFDHDWRFMVFPKMLFYMPGVGYIPRCFIVLNICVVFCEVFLFLWIGPESSPLLPGTRALWHRRGDFEFFWIRSSFPFGRHGKQFKEANPAHLLFQDKGAMLFGVAKKPAKSMAPLGVLVVAWWFQTLLGNSKCPYSQREKSPRLLRGGGATRGHFSRELAGAWTSPNTPEIPKASLKRKAK